MRILYYAEFDPFAGIGQTAADLREALSDVAVACLLHDVVLVQPDNLLEHSLTLPIFERLAPFVRAGRLTTSADVSAAPPREYLHGRVDQALARAARSRRRDRAAHRRELDEIRRRYAALMPRTWVVARSVRAQVGLFAGRMRTYLAECPRAGWVDRRLLGWVEARLDAGLRVDRDFVFTQLARLRGSASPRDLARIGAFAQALLLEGGAAGHAAEPTVHGDRCLIYPGRFAARLRAEDPRRARLAAPPFAAAARPEAVRRRLATIGVALDGLLALPPSELLEVASSPEWARIRNVDEVPAELADEVRARFAAVRDVRDALPDAVTLLPAVPATPPPMPLRLPEPWRLATQTLLATALPAAPAGEPVLDLTRLELRRGGRTARLTQAEAELCVAITIAGDAGLPIDQWKQLKADTDQLVAAGSDDGAVTWRDQHDEPITRDEGRRVLLAVTRHHAGRALAAIGLAIQAATDRLTIVGADADAATVVPRLEGTLWDLLGGPPDAPAPTGLAPAEQTLYRALADASPALLPIRALATALAKADDERGIQQTTDAVGKLTRRLSALAAPLRVARIRRGLYALVPTSAQPGEVH